MSGVYGYSNDPTSTTGTVGTGGGAGGVVIDEGNTTVAALNNAQRGLVGDMGMYRNDTSGKLTTGGSANAYTVTLESVPTALADGLGFSAIISASNTGATTINVNSLGAKKVLYKGVALSGGELITGQVYRFSYDASADSAAGAWLVENPTPVPASISFSASEIANDSGVTGTNVDDALNTLKTDADALVAGVSASFDTLAEVEAKFSTVDTAIAAKAPLASPALTGSPTAPTASEGDDSTKIATTAYVATAVAAAPGGGILDDMYTLDRTKHKSTTGKTLLDTWTYSSSTTYVTFTGLSQAHDHLWIEADGIDAINQITVGFSINNSTYGSNIAIFTRDTTFGNGIIWDYTNTGLSGRFHNSFAYDPSSLTGTARSGYGLHSANALGATTAIRFYFNGGQSAGTIRVYGI